MLNVGPNSSPVVVFTAPVTSLYAIGFIPHNNGNVDFVRALYGDNVSPGVFLLEEGETITYRGPAARLAMVRLGDELSSEARVARKPGPKPQLKPAPDKAPEKADEPAKEPK